MRRRGNWLLRVTSAVCVSVAALGAPAPPAGASGDPSYGKQWGLALVGAQTAWSVGTGSGITIAVVDTGVDLGHEDLRAKILPGKNFVGETGSAQDDNGHGSHVAGTAAASTGNGVGVAGVAPGASILPVKVLGSGGRGSVGHISAGIRWAADRGAHVINLSLGPNAVLGALLGNGLEDDVNYAWAKGSIVVIAAGNDILFESSAGDVPAIVVTATTRHDKLADRYASTVGKSARWGMSAPGGAGGFNEADDILSTYWEERSANSYAFLAGTSMATPHVAGAAAVLRGLGLNPQETVDRLLATAKDLGSPGRDDTFGSGRLDLACAVGRCGDTTTTAAARVGDQTTGSGSGTAGSDGKGTTTNGSGAGNAGSDGSGPGGEAPAASGAGGPAGGAGVSGTRSGTAGRKATGGRRSGLAPPADAVPPTAAPSPPGAVTERAIGEEIPGGAGGVTTSAELVEAGHGLSLSTAATDERSNMVLSATAAGLLLLVASWAFRLSRRRLGIS